MKHLLILLLLTSSLCISCFSNESGGDNTNNTGSDSSTVDITDYAIPVTGTVYDDSTDIVTNTSFDYTITIDLSSNTAQLGTGTAETVTESGITPVTGITIATSSSGITITSTISSAVKYSITGDLEGTLQISSTNPCQIYLNGTTINGSDGPALYISSDSKTFIVLAENTTNTLTDKSTASGKKAALYGDGPMIFSGDGSLSVTGNYKHGIFSSDYIRIREGTISVTVTSRDAIRTINGFIFDDGNLTINGTGNVTDNESKGIKVEGDESSDGAGKGYIVINGGYITITSVSKAITASFDITEDGDTSSTTYDPSPFVLINNGVITITTTGTPYENQDGTSCSPEGIEGKSTVTINSAYIVVNTSDDCINAGDSVVINGGYIYAKSTENDSIDSNGTLSISGGVIVAIGSSAPEGSFDCDSSTFSVTGGTFVGIGGNVSRLYAANCSQNVVVLGGMTSGSTMSLVSENGTAVFAYTIPQSYATMILSSPDISSNTKYYVKYGGTATADDSFYGLFLDNITYSSGGSTYTTITTTSTVTNSGGTFF